MTTQEVFDRVQVIQSLAETRAIEKHLAEGGEEVLEYINNLKWRKDYINVELIYQKSADIGKQECTNVYISSEEVDLTHKEWEEYIESIKQKGKKSLLQIAYEIAREVFEGKADKSGEPYMNHIHVVAYPFTRGEMEYDDNIYNQDLEIVAVLHDLLEDCKDWSTERLKDLGFSEKVLDALIAITKTKKESYSDYIERVSKNDYAIQVKIADLEHNMDITRLKTLTSTDIKRISKYHKAYMYLKALRNLYQNG